MFPIGFVELASVGVVALVAVAAAWLLGRFTRWSKRRVLVVSALPIPGIIAALCVAVFVNAATSSRAACGIDACAMAMGAALTGLVLAGVAFALSLLLGSIGYWHSRS